jgi:all-trans-8'-apo-beta-carotenal 15,15'-oxygenase
MIRVIVGAAAAVHSLRCPPPIARLTPLKATTLDKLDDVWNGAYREADWEATYNSLPADALAEPTIVPVKGVVPASLRGGVLYRCSPANFDRGGTRYKHVLDGDGFMLRVAFDQDGTKATVTGRYVETTPYVEETTADEILYRNTFGTQPTGGPLRNAFTVTLKNVANTNVISWGGRLLALWEAGAPHELDAVTLETMGEATDLCRGPPAGKKCTRGVTIDGGIIDETLGFGESFTAHPHVDGDKLVAFTWAQQPQREEMGLTFREINNDWTDDVPPVSHAMPDCALAPHDCGLTENYHVVVENRASIQMAPFVLGLKGPAQVLEIATKSGARCHLIPRAGSGLTKPVVVDIPPFFCIHVGDAWEDGDGRVHVVTSAWDLRDPTHFPRDKDAVPFLGAWSGPAPDFKRIPPSLLFETVVDPATGTLVSHENPQPVRGLCIEHPHVDGSGKVWASLANDRGVSSPPSGYVCYDLETGGVERWYAGPRKFCEELVVAPKGGDDEGAWLLGMIYDAATDASSVNVFDGDRIAAGPVAVVPLPHAVPHGLHGCFQPVDGPMSA